MSNYSFGLNTRNISTSNRTTKAVIIGSLKGGSKGSTSRIYKWCNRHCPADPISCVFQQFNTSSESSWTNTDVSQLNLGEITGNIGSAGQIILGGANGGQLQFSTNLGNTWSPYTGSPNLPGGINGVGWSSVVMSDDTRFVVGTPYVSDQATDSDFDSYNGVWFKSGTTSPWILLKSCSLESGGTLDFNDINGSGKKLLFIDAGISQDGNYMAVLTTPRFEDGELVYLIFSNNAGSTWTAYTLDPYTTPYKVTTNASSISIANVSGTSDFFLITSKLYFNPTPSPGAYQNGTCCVSNNGGTTFTVPTGVSGNDFIYSSISDNGQYQVFVTATNPQSIDISTPSRLYLSSNSGNSFNQIIQLPYTDDTNYLVFGGVSMSANGNHITASVLDQDGVFQYIYISSDIGVTWKKIYNDSTGSTISVLGQYAGFLNVNYSGQYQMLTGLNKLYINNNYGN